MTFTLSDLKALNETIKHNLVKCDYLLMAGHKVVLSINELCNKKYKNYVYRIKYLLNFNHKFGFPVKILPS